MFFCDTFFLCFTCLSFMFSMFKAVISHPILFQFTTAIFYSGKFISHKLSNQKCNQKQLDLKN